MSIEQQKVETNLFGGVSVVVGSPSPIEIPISISPEIPESVIVENPTQTGFEPSLHFISESPSKTAKRNAFKEVYNEVMAKYVNATYKERLEYGRYEVSELEKSNSDINPEVFKSMKRSFAARIGIENSKINALKKEIEAQEVCVELTNGNSVEYHHPWKCVVEKVLNQKEGLDCDMERETYVLLRKIVKFKDSIKKEIYSRTKIKANKPCSFKDIHKMCEEYIVNSMVMPRLDEKNVDNVLNTKAIDDYLQKINGNTNADNYLSTKAEIEIKEYFSLYTFKKWIDNVIKRERNISKY